MEAATTLAYFDTAIDTAVNSFIVQAPGPSFQLYTRDKSRVENSAQVLSC
jgi:hypothetical protein